MIVAGETLQEDKRVDIFRPGRVPNFVPFGADLTLKSVKKWSQEVIVYSQTPEEKRPLDDCLPLPPTSTVDFEEWLAKEDKECRGPSVFLEVGSYLIDFNESIAVPTGYAAQFAVHKNLCCSGALVHQGWVHGDSVGPSGFHPADGDFRVVLQVVNPHGVRIFQGATVGQVLFHEVGPPMDKGIGTRHVSREATLLPYRGGAS